MPGREAFIARLIDWAMRSQWIWSIFPAGWKSYIVGIIAIGLGSLLRWLHKLTFAHLAIISIIAIGYVLLALLLQRERISLTSIRPEILACRFVAENLGESTSDNYREAYNVFLKLRCVTGGGTRLSLSRATLEIRINENTQTFIIDNARLDRFRLQEHSNGTDQCLGFSETTGGFSCPTCSE